MFPLSREEAFSPSLYFPDSLRRIAGKRTQLDGSWLRRFHADSSIETVKAHIYITVIVRMVEYYDDETNKKAFAAVGGTDIGSQLP